MEDIHREVCEIPIEDIKIILERCVEYKAINEDDEYFLMDYIYNNTIE